MKDWNHQSFKLPMILGESVMVRWDQNPALWHQLNLPWFGGGRMQSMTPRIPSPLSNMEVKTLCFGVVFSAKGTGQLHHIKGTMDGALYRQGQGIEASQGIENGSWMGIPACHWPKNTRPRQKVWLKKKHIKVLANQFITFCKSVYLDFLLLFCL